MNFDLVPCTITGCADAGWYTVSSNRGIMQVCSTHALAISEMDERAKGELDIAIERTGHDGS